MSNSATTISATAISLDPLFKVGASVVIRSSNTGNIYRARITKITKTMFFVGKTRFYISGSSAERFLPVGYSNIQNAYTWSSLTHSLETV